VLDVIWLVPALPLVGFLTILLLGRRLGEPGAGYIAAAAVLGSFLVTVGAFFDLLSMDEHHREHVSVLFSWVPVSSLQIDMALLADPLSITMALFVTGIGFLIHLFAIGYMHGDPKFPKFFLYLNLFVLSMLMLVLGENLLVTFLGWEGVGACSYFLISFWHTRESAATAGKKAFVTNRIGDWGVMLAMFLGFQAVGSVSYSALNGAAESGALASSTATGIALLLFVGAAGKSAQLPLYLWLPDAMEGPTPVSALIHAATMVTAGVFLMTRMNPVIAASADYAPQIIAWVGALTALFAATIAVAQHDIKKVLAYSTVSQLGYMFLAVGTGAYVAAVFHMVTHAFFKALMFLGSGSVIHGMHHEQDMRRMGALRTVMPITAGTFIVGWLAIAGVPPFAGFWSKDEILLFTLASSPVLYVIGLVTAVLTAFYMTRQVVMVFFGEARWESHADDHGAHGEFRPHESPPIMLVPLVVLAGLSMVGGVIQLPSFGIIPDGWRHRLEDWLHPVVEPGEAVIKGTGAYDAKSWLALLAIACAALGIAAAIAVYAKGRAKPFEPELLARGWRYDEAISAFMGGPGRRAFDAVDSTPRSSTGPSPARRPVFARWPSASAAARRALYATTRPWWSPGCSASSSGS
jgi:NADH-quinone oxidoreductase subunit L